MAESESNDCLFQMKSRPILSSCKKKRTNTHRCWTMETKIKIKIRYYNTAQVKTNLKNKEANRNEKQSDAKPKHFSLITILRNGMEINNNKYLRSRSRAPCMCFLIKIMKDEIVSRWRRQQTQNEEEWNRKTGSTKKKTEQKIKCINK